MKKRTTKNPLSIQSDVERTDENLIDAEEEAAWQAELKAANLERKAEERFKKSLSSNPIVAALQIALKRSGVSASIQRGCTERAELEKIIGKVFDVEFVQQLGKMLLVALLSGDKEFSGFVKRAVKQSDSVFKRNRELAIAKDVTEYVWSLPEPLPADAELKIAVEKHCNRGKELTKHQWERLRKVCLIPLRPRGRPKTKQH